ncbi:hypothetical protein [Rhizobium lusitanum]|uniref:Uncharacterized protein n=1 Tax=Rhizobium lusitanum TaxID=293958 RepID=A0A7X0MHH9_9HYPH|nr:hypothetical protein [Rhizobium lusitanum]MBB6489158.1 hypothetical protein [Rhizobium lusitanum]
MKSPAITIVVADMVLAFEGKMPMPEIGEKSDACLPDTLLHT